MPALQHSQEPPCAIGYWEEHCHVEGNASMLTQQFKSCLTWSLRAVSLPPMEVSFCLTPFTYFCTDTVFLLHFFSSCSTTLLSLEIISARLCGKGLVLPVPIVSGEDWFAAKRYWRETGGITVAALAQSPGFGVLNLPISGTKCSASVEPSVSTFSTKAVRVGCPTAIEQDYGIFGLIWKSEETSEIILEYAQQTAW